MRDVPRRLYHCGKRGSTAQVKGLAPGRFRLNLGRWSDNGEAGVFKNVAKVLVLLGGVTASALVVAGDELPIAGTYTKDQPCKGDGSDPADAVVTITRDAVQSSLGSCTILDTSQSGKAFSMQVECKVPGDQIIQGDVTFTQREANVLDFDDQDHTSPAVLYRCVNGSAAAPSRR